MSIPKERSAGETQVRNSGRFPSINVGSLLILIPTVFLIIFFILPIGQMFTFSVQTYDPLKLIIKEFTWENYRSIVADSYITTILFRTLRVALLTTVVSAILAFPIAFRMRQAAGIEKLLLTLIVLAPLMVSLIVLAYSWIVILAPNTGMLNNLMTSLGLPGLKVMFTETGVLVGLVYANMVFMVLNLHAALENIDENLLRAARTHGANSAQVFLRVILPLSLPGLVSGSLIVFSISSSSFVLPLMLGGRQVPVLATYAYDQASFVLNWPSASAIAAVLVVIAGSTNLVYTSWIRTVERRLGLLDEENTG